MSLITKIENLKKQNVQFEEKIRKLRILQTKNLAEIDRIETRVSTHEQHLRDQIVRKTREIESLQNEHRVTIKTNLMIE